jgi:hypothetical protein
MQRPPSGIPSQHFRDVVFGFLGAIHFANASHQPDSAFAEGGHLLFGGHRSVAGTTVSKSSCSAERSVLGHSTALPPPE